MKAFTALLVMCTIFAAGFAAPTRNEEVTVQDILAAIEEANMVAREQDMRTFKGLLRSSLNNTLNYLRNKFLRSGTALQPSEMAKIEEETLRELLGGILNSVNNYAQNKLTRKPQEKETARIEQNNLKQLLGMFLKDASNYAQQKLRAPSEMEFEEANAEEDAVSQEKEDEVDEQVFATILPLIIKYAPLIASLFSNQGESGGFFSGLFSGR